MSLLIYSVSNRDMKQKQIRFFFSREKIQKYRVKMGLMVCLKLLNTLLDASLRFSGVQTESECLSDGFVFQKVL